MAASKSSAAALLLAALLLFAAATALAQTPEEPEDEEPGCPTAADLDPVIVNGVLLRRQQMISDSLQEMIDELTTTELGQCICERIVPATGITSGGTGMVITRLAKEVLKSLNRNIPVDFECNLEATP